MGSYSPLKPGDERNLLGDEDPLVAEQVLEGQRERKHFIFQVNYIWTLVEGDHYLKLYTNLFLNCLAEIRQAILSFSCF